MVKIRAKSLLLSVVMLVFLIGTAYAAAPRLEFSDVDAKVAGKFDRNLKDGDRIDEQARPGETVEFNVEVKNNFTREEGLEIEDITIEITIEDIDDNSDLDEESREFDLNPQRDARRTLEFRVPAEVAERDYNVVIRALGQDINGTSHEIEMRLLLEVEKENHLLNIIRSALSPSVVSCSRKNIQLDVIVLNVGNEDEDDISIEIISPELGLGLRDNVYELLAEPNEPEARFSKIYKFNVDDKVKAGSYPILVRVSYDNDRAKTEETVILTVNDCSAEKPQQIIVEVPEKKEGMEQDISSAAQNGRTVAVQQAPFATRSTEGFLSGSVFMAAVIIAEIAAVVAGIILIVRLVARRG